MGKKYIIGLLFMLLTSGCKSDSCKIAPIETSFGTLYINHAHFKKVDQICLTNEIHTLLSEIEKGHIDPYKNKVFKEHPLVEAITNNTYIDIKRDTHQQSILIPVDENNQKIVLYQDSIYALYRLEDKNFQQRLHKCFQ
jgi:hypothetical protein